MFCHKIQDTLFGYFEQENLVYIVVSNNNNNNNNKSNIGVVSANDYHSCDKTKKKHKKRNRKKKKKKPKHNHNHTTTTAPATAGNNNNNNDNNYNRNEQNSSARDNILITNYNSNNVKNSHPIDSTSNSNSNSNNNTESTADSNSNDNSEHSEDTFNNGSCNINDNFDSYEKNITPSKRKRDSGNYNYNYNCNYNNSYTEIEIDSYRDIDIGVDIEIDIQSSFSSSSIAENSASASTSTSTSTTCTSTSALTSTTPSIATHHPTATFRSSTTTPATTTTTATTTKTTTNATNRSRANTIISNLPYCIEIKSTKRSKSTTTKSTSNNTTKSTAASTKTTKSTAASTKTAAAATTTATTTNKSRKRKTMGCGGSKQNDDVEVMERSMPPLNFGDRVDGPRDAICHICGRKYTVHSINIHIPQCEKKFVAQQQQLPRKERKKVPKLPRGVSKMTIEERNEVAQKLYETAVMEQCPYCNRTFMEGRLEKHIYNCARNHGKEHKDPKDNAQYHIGPMEASNTVICHVCGRKYTTHSIDIHLPQCEKLFLARQEKLPKKERQPLPKLPDNVDKMTLEERNEFAMKQFNDTALVGCKYCGRTFYPDRLEVHIKSCERNYIKENGGLPPPTNDNNKEDDDANTAHTTIPTEAHNTVICHVCGRKYTTHSIGIHLPQCEKLFLARQEKLPEKERKPLPTLPDNVDSMTLDERNEYATQQYNDHALDECKYCGRTFFPDRLQIHIKSCERNHAKQNGNNHATTTTTTNDQKKNDPHSPTSADANQHHIQDVICHVCGRKYTTRSIEIHLPQCEKLFLARQEKLPEKERKPLPKLPDNVDKMTLDERNEYAMQQYNDHALDTCKYCGRTFFPDRLQIHIKSCERNHAKQNGNGGGNTTPTNNNDHKKTTPTTSPMAIDHHANDVICHVCGRNYTTRSIDIHLPQCEKLFLARQEKLPEKDRKPLPKLPDDVGTMTLEERNEYAQQQYNDHALDTCKFCGRTFFPDRLQIHIKSCERDHNKNHHTTVANKKQKTG